MNDCECAGALPPEAIAAAEATAGSTPLTPPLTALNDPILQGGIAEALRLLVSLLR